MMNKLKAHFLQHTTAYVIGGAVTGVVAIALVCVVFVLVRLVLPAARSTPTPVLTSTPIAAPDAIACTQPEMKPLPPTTLNAASVTSTQIVAPRGRAGDPLPFLELPFPYDGGNEKFGGTDAQFRRASQRLRAGGRINSFFDHFYPLYPSPKAKAVTAGREPADPPIGDDILIFDGTLSGNDNYSGHPAIDFSPFIPRTPTTPVFAAADGQVYDVGIHAASGAYYVKIKHTVVGVGDFLTIYWHLNPDQYFDAMRGRVGQPIHAGERIGTMGNTGWSTGHHLHFEVRFDRNRDGQFTGDETIDPYGFTPSAAYPNDPWGQPEDIIDALGRPYHHAPSISWYLWIHPLGATVQVPPDGGGQVALSISAVNTATVEASACAPKGSLPPNGVVNWSMSPDPRPTDTTAGTGNSHVLSVFDPNGNAVDRFDPPLEIQIPFDQEDLKNVDPNTLTIYRAEANSDQWIPLPTRFDLRKRLAIAFTDRPGRFSLMGKPMRDLVAPTTGIQFSGVTAPDGSLYDKVEVTLKADDPSGIKQIEYSVDGGSMWLIYTGTFTLEPNGIPQPLPDDAEETFGGGPGRFLVLASATDNAGNVEEPPAYRSIVIDPSKAPTPTPTKTPTRRPPTRTPTPTPTATPSISFRADPTLIGLRQCSTLRWDVENVQAVWLQNDPVSGHSKRSVCPQETTTYTLRVKFFDGSTKEYQATVTVDNVLPPAPTLIAPIHEDYFVCVSDGTIPVTLQWTAVTDASGIKQYTWTLDRMDLYSGGTPVPYTPFKSNSTDQLQRTTNVPCGLYRWTVRAVDNAGNVGPPAAFGYFEAGPPGPS
jgi:murein DD-endopeptidase MepM/ murein hydrolase activator NlpD